MPDWIRFRLSLRRLYHPKRTFPVARKCIALGLILQETSRTFIDKVADSAMDATVRNLGREFAAELRD